MTELTVRTKVGFLERYVPWVCEAETLAEMARRAKHVADHLEAMAREEGDTDPLSEPGAFR